MRVRTRAEKQPLPALSMAVLHQPLDAKHSEDLLGWLARAFDEANVEFFGGSLAAKVRLDETWHLRRFGAGGAHPSTKRIVLDPLVHFTRRDLCATMLHEMLHLRIGAAGIDSDAEEHSDEFVLQCLKLNLDILASGLPCYCRLGEHDTALDQEVLAQAVDDELSEADLLSLSRCLSKTSQGVSCWDTDLLVGDLRRCLQTDVADKIAGRLQNLATARSCRLALRSGYDSWCIKSRTMSRYCATKKGRDYQLFSAYAEAWSL
eukprot:s5283_g5.t1